MLWEIKVYTGSSFPDRYVGERWECELFLYGYRQLRHSYTLRHDPFTRSV